MTLFVGRDGKMAYIHTGPYTSVSQLTADIHRYLGVRTTASAAH
jgi:hypothetical protein